MPLGTDWTTGDDTDVIHVEILSDAGYGEVHKVKSVI